MKFNMPYKVLLVLFIIFFTASCRTSKPPQVTVCLGNGSGGAICKDPQGVITTKLPSELEDYFMLSEQDAKDFTSWCYDTKLQTIEPAFDNLTTVMREKQRYEPAPY